MTQVGRASRGSGQHRALIVDLNNYARYPTLAIGYLVAALRNGGFDVEVLTPLSHGVPAVEREHPETAWEQFQRRVYFSSHPLMLTWHDALRRARTRWIGRPHPRLIQELERLLGDGRFDILLMSAYMDHYPSVVAAGRVAAQHNVPVLLGGPVFNLPHVAEQWLDVPGLAAIVGAEVDLTLPEIVRGVFDGGDLTRHEGVHLPDGRTGPRPRPLRELERLPTPDFSDFPWDNYPMRVIPIMSGRGCNWGRCLFCADIHTANGRTFRSRPVDAVLGEAEEQAARYGSTNFIFLDIKLNSDLAMWDGLTERLGVRVPGARWIGWVHVQARGENGLDRDRLATAAAGGLTRVTFGFETGSQRLNDAMAKGTSIERMSRFAKDAHAVGISVRMSAIVGYPGETATDIAASHRFVEEHAAYIDRVRLNLFKAIPGTYFHERFEGDPGRYPGIQNLRWDYRFARGPHEYAPARDREYRRAKTRYLELVHRINSQPLRDEAQVFEGLM